MRHLHIEEKNMVAKTPKQAISELHDKYYGNKKEKIAVTVASLHEKAKARGIKYFRILTKEELLQVTADSINPQEITAITESAKERWKSGWGKKGRKVEA